MPTELPFVCRNCNVRVDTDAEAFIHGRLHSGNLEWSEWGTPHKLNALPYIFFPIVARLMEEYRRESN